MPNRTSSRRFSKQSWEELIAESPPQYNQRILEGVVAGCAIMAYADGWVTDDERRRMLGLIRRFEPIAVFGLDDINGYFEEISAVFIDDHDKGERESLAILSRLSGESRNAALLVEACCAIASADSCFDADERAAAVRICDALGLDPANFDLADAA